VGVASESFLWSTAEVPSSPLYRIRLICNTDTNVLDSSRTDFTIRNASLRYYVNDGSTNGDVYCTAAGDDANNGITPFTPKATVQAIVDAYNLKPGDTVYVDTGLYHLTNAIAVTSADQGDATANVVFQGAGRPNGTVLDRGGTNAGNYAWSLYDCGRVQVSGFVITNAYSGIFLSGSVYAGVLNCLLSGNEIRGTIRGIDAGRPARSNTLRNNLLTGNAYGIYIRTDSSYGNGNAVLNNTLAGNSTAGLFLESAVWTMTVSNNVFVQSGAGHCIYNQYSSLSLTGCDYNDFHVVGGAAVGYFGGPRAQLGDWQAATGMDKHSFSSDPLFANSAAGDYHLQSTGGSWHDGAWTADPADSPCVDAGDPADSVGAEPAPNGSRINLGAYGGTAQASHSTAGRRVAVLDPNGGETWRGLRTIRWATYGQAWQGTDTVSLSYSPDSGSNWTAIASGAGVPVCAGQFDWNLSGLPTGASYRVRAVCDHEPTVLDLSDRNFSVGGGGLFYVNDGATNGDVYCTATGSDANDGLSRATPKASLQAILDTYAVGTGGVVLVDSGTYALASNVVVSAADSGTADYPVRIVGVGNKTILDRGAPLSNGTACIQIAADYVWLENLVCENANTGMGLLSGHGPSRISNSRVTGCGAYGVYADQHMVVMTHNVVAHNGANEAVCIHGINYLGWYLALPCALENNTLLAARTNALAVYAKSGPIVRNNIIQAGGLGACCIVAATDSTGVDTCDYNLLRPVDGAQVGRLNEDEGADLDAWRALAGWDAHSFSADPLFANAGTGDYHLQSASGRYDPGT
ncbi:MAG: right-handed parallel beta-helix repeat-containing protein, partial [Acidobacteria bacterium]|nr:right-handed parallel beta-helix repeat-containing protein [Acidobacteriota bacterium]